MRQRVVIAIAIANDPRLIIADEPTTALDVTVQAQILEVLKLARAETGAALILITHDLGVVAEVTDDVLVMYAGQCMEYGSVNDVFYEPEHPYTWGLLSSVTRLDRVREDRLRPIPGLPPSLINVPSGCPFHPRCTYAARTNGKSQTERVVLREATPGHKVACHLAHEERVKAFKEEIAPNL
jgi:peptide/nickel transport system ATP-binding protein